MKILCGKLVGKGNYTVNDAATSTNMYKTNATTNKTALGFVVKVMAGDVVNIFGKSYYYAPATTFTNSNSASLAVADLFNAFLGSTGNPASAKGISEPSLETLNSGSYALPSNLIRGSDGTSSSSPKAYINYIILDDQLRYVTSGFSRVGASGAVKNHWNDASMKNIAVPKNGYLYVYVSNESNQDVFFDNLQVVHVRGPLVEETHYYPFGLVQQGISSKAMAFGGAENKRKFNGANELQSNEFSDGSGLEMYDAVNRMYDPQLGRFGQIDPLAKATCEESPYSFAHNNPLLFNDPLGLKAQSDSTRAPDGENVADKGSMEPVVVVALSKKFWVLQNFYYDMMAGLKRRGATIDDIPQDNVREMMYRFDAITKHRDRVDEMMYASDAYVWGAFLSPLAALFVAEVGAPLIYQGGRLLVRVGNKLIPWEKIGALYDDATFEIWLHGNKLVNGLRSELLAAMAALYKNDPAKWDKLMNQSKEVKDVMGPIMKFIDQQAQKQATKPDGGVIPKVGQRMNF